MLEQLRLLQAQLAVDQAMERVILRGRHEAAEVIALPREKVLCRMDFLEVQTTASPAPGADC
jgi:hypothetical protein